MSRKRPAEEVVDFDLDGPGAASGDNDGGGSSPEGVHRRRRVGAAGAGWGLAEVLAECGLDPGPGDEDDGDGDAEGDLGCRLLPDVSPASLRSGISSLLSEMDRNGIDRGNERVASELEGWISGASGPTPSSLPSLVRGGDGPSGVLRRMLLPLHRVRERSFLSQPEVGSPGGGAAEGGKRAVEETSSLIRVLLRVDALQPTVMSGLLRRLGEIAASSGDDDEEMDDDGSAGGGANNNDAPEDLPRLALAALRWPEHVVDPPSLLSAYCGTLEMIASASSSSERARGMLLDAIGAVPDVLNDVHGSRTAPGRRTDGEDDDDEEEGGGEASILETPPVAQVRGPVPPHTGTRRRGIPAPERRGDGKRDVGRPRGARDRRGVGPPGPGGVPDEPRP
ncbi:hypothetical protein THAOC_18261, partial [Thalassiosira oceanica]